MRIGFGCDHAGVELKRILMDHLAEKGHECVDYGTPDASIKMDYPIPGRKVAEEHGIYATRIRLNEIYQAERLGGSEEICTLQS